MYKSEERLTRAATLCTVEAKQAPCRADSSAGAQPSLHKRVDGGGGVGGGVHAGGGMVHK